MAIIDVLMGLGIGLVAGVYVAPVLTPLLKKVGMPDPALKNKPKSSDMGSKNHGDPEQRKVLSHEGKTDAVAGSPHPPEKDAVRKYRFEGHQEWALGKKKCGRCGLAMLSGWDYCPNCGQGGD